MRKQNWLRAIVAVALVLICASWGLSRALRDGWARRSLLARVSASFGRPVEVGYFGFSLLGGVRLEAHSVTVSEDPRFGAEYFLRAEELTASPRWGALLRGRLELGTISFSGASLNLVRAADGRWNVESWLPPRSPGDALPGADVPAASPAAQPAAQLSRIDIDRSRINFKRGDEKLPFALVDVSGNLHQDASGRWNVDVEAHPMRASVVLQEAGTVRLRGTVAGTTARLQPASISLVWADASVADAIRLVQGTDYGIRGKLAAELSTTISDRASSPGIWVIAGNIRLSDMHRWDLPPRQTDPAVNLNVTAEWDPGKQRVEIMRCLVEAPQSNLAASGEVSWSNGLRPALRVQESEIAFKDLLDWRRAFLPGLADDLIVEGSLRADATLAGWPLRVGDAALRSSGATVRTPAFDAPVRLGKMEATLHDGSLVLKPVEMQIAVSTASPLELGTQQLPSTPLRVDGLFGPVLTGSERGKWGYRLTLRGETARSQDIVGLASAMAPPASTHWTLEGPAEFRLAWSGVLRQAPPQTQGTIRLHEARLSSALLDGPLILSSASVELRSDVTRVKIDAAEAFGAHWKGSLERRSREAAWDFDLSADHLDAAELSRWFGSRDRPTLLSRILPFSSPSRSTLTQEAAMQQLRAQGRLRVGDLTLDRVHVASLDARVVLAGQELAMHAVKGDVYGGRVAGEFTARLSATPSYEFRGHINGADISAVAEMIPSLSGRIAGSASGQIIVAARGTQQDDLLRSLQGSGSFRIRDAAVRSPDLLAGIDEIGSNTQARSQGRFGSAMAKLRMGSGRLRIEQLLFTDRDDQFEVTGDMSFSGALDLRVTAVPRTEAAAETDASFRPDPWVVGGTLQSPEITPPARVARDRAGASTARR